MADLNDRYLTTYDVWDTLSSQGAWCLSRDKTYSLDQLGISATSNEAHVQSLSVELLGWVDIFCGI